MSMNTFRIDARQRRCAGTPAVQEAAKSYRILLIALLGSMTSACAPYYESGSYYRSDYYTSDRYAAPGYYRYDRYYVAPQPRYYYQPAPRYYYQPAPRYRYQPAPNYRPQPRPPVTQWHGNPRHDYGNRQRDDYRGDRDRHDYRDGSQRYPRGGWQSNGPGNGGGPGDGPRGQGQWQR